MFKIDELTGVLPALISPLHSDGKVDEDGVGRLVEHVIDQGVHGLLALGSTGETASLDETARRTILASVVAAAAATTLARIVRRAASSSEAVSPVDPSARRPCTPWSITCSTRRPTPSSSTFPSLCSGEISAGSTPVSSSILNMDLKG